MPRPLRISERLIELIEQIGFRSVRLRPANGTWRTAIRRDIYRWEGSGISAGYVHLPDGMGVSFASWDTMTDCVRYGVILGEGDARISTDFLVHILSSRSLTDHEPHSEKR